MSKNRAIEGLRFALSVAICSCIATSGCESSSSTVERVRIRDFRGVEGYWYDHDIEPATIRITYGDDFGERDKHVWDAKIESDKKRNLQQALRSVPLFELKELYEDPSVDDGVQLTFEFETKAGKTRTIEVRNSDQSNLQALVRVINTSVPSEYRIVEEWSFDSSGRSGVRAGG